MKFILKGPFAENSYSLMRKLGYTFQKKQDSEMSFIRPLERQSWPRFHIYLKENSAANKLVFNLHLDQRKTRYKGAAAHSGEYKTGLVKNEMERIKKSLSFSETGSRKKL